MNLIQQAVARGQSSPFTGKLSARPAGQPGSWIAKENLRRSPARPLARKNTEAPQYAFFKAWRNLSIRCRVLIRALRALKPGAGYRLLTASRLPGDLVHGQDHPLPLSPAAFGPGPSYQDMQEEHALPIIVSMSSGRLILDRVARLHCPSPLYRHPQINMHSATAQAKGDISTLPGRGHFYFALTQ
jgi:hypothetical protein